MKIRALVLGALAVLVIACGTSNVGNDAAVTVSGALQLPDGSPAAGVPVGLIEEPGGIDALVELTVTVTSIGMLCLTQQVSICQGARRTTTDEQGRYSFSMKGKDTKSILGNPARFALSSRLDAGPRVQTRFQIGAEQVAVPTMKFWQPEGLKVTAGRERVEFSWPPLKGASHRLEVTQADELVWTQETGPSGSFDARAIADAQGDFRAIARVERDGFITDHHSPPVGVRGQAGEPPSRGRACSMPWGPMEPCVVTDGRYSGTFPARSNASPSPSSPPANNWITIDLGTVRHVEVVFLHGLSTSKEVEVSVSPDGVQWTRRARHKRVSHAGLMLNPPTLARYVRIESESIHGLQEASAWGISGVGSR